MLLPQTVTKDLKRLFVPSILLSHKSPELAGVVREENEQPGKTQDRHKYVTQQNLDN